MAGRVVATKHGRVFRVDGGTTAEILADPALLDAVGVTALRHLCVLELQTLFVCAQSDVLGVRQLFHMEVEGAAARVVVYTDPHTAEPAVRPPLAAVKQAATALEATSPRWLNLLVIVVICGGYYFAVVPIAERVLQAGPLADLLDYRVATLLGLIPFVLSGILRLRAPMSWTYATQQGVHALLFSVFAFVFAACVALEASGPQPNTLYMVVGGVALSACTSHIVRYVRAMQILRPTGV